jgi:hypothetical protein
LPASPGAASGKVVFSAEEAEKLAERGEAVGATGGEIRLSVGADNWLGSSSRRRLESDVTVPVVAIADVQPDPAVVFAVWQIES